MGGWLAVWQSEHNPSCLSGVTLFTNGPLLSVTYVWIHESYLAPLISSVKGRGNKKFLTFPQPPPPSCFYQLDNPSRMMRKPQRWRRGRRKREAGRSSGCDERGDGLANALCTRWRQEEIIEWTEGGDAGLEDGRSRVQSGDDVTKDQSAGEEGRGKSSGRRQLQISPEIK